MSNPISKIGFTLKSKFGLIPGSSKIERDDHATREEYNQLLEYEKSGEPARYQELEAFVTSQDFKDRKREINSQRFENTDAYARMKELKELKSSSEIKNYFKFVKSAHFENFKKNENSKELKHHEELRDLINTQEFKENLRKKFKDTEEYQKYLDYKRLKASPEIIHYYQVVHSKDFPVFEKLRDSKQVKHFEVLDSFVHSVEFHTMKKTMKSSDLKETPEFQKYEEYNKLTRDPELKAYLSIKNSKAFPDFVLLNGSSELKEFEKLEKFVNGGGLEQAKNEFAGEILAGKQRLAQFKQEKRSGKFKGYYVLKNSTMYEDYKNLEGSKELKHIIELEEYVQSAEFKEIRQYMKSANKFKKSEEYQRLQEYLSLKRLPKIKWYFRQIKSKKFNEVRNYEISFFDDFDSKTLDKKKWITSYYWGNKFLKDGYSIVNEPHLLTNGENVHLEDSKVKIITKKEKMAGKAWDPAIGFYPQEFNFTSGIISSGEGFRQKYGIFEAKVKLNASPHVFHSFWMLSERMVPHVDIFRFSGKNKKRLELNSFVGNGSPAGSIKSERSSVGGINFAGGFNIIRLEWYADKLVWKLNNQVVNVQKSNVPQEEMYFSFSSGVIGMDAELPAPVAMEIDWVRCQKLKDKLPAE